MAPPSSRESGRRETTMLVVALGASAGGLSALRAFFAESFDPKKVAFVLTHHIDASGQSLAHEVISHLSSFEVVDVGQRTAIQPGRIHMLPPQTILVAEEGRFRARIAKNRDERLTLIDSTFRAIAHEFGSRSVGIVFSGEGADGSQGLLAISQAGGLTIAQTPETAEHTSMPSNAIATGAVDHVLAPKAMARVIESHADYFDQVVSVKPVVQDLKEKIAYSLVKICDILNQATHHDFKHYKTTTLIRRIQRRMQVLQISSVDTYVERLETHTEEADALFKELLINVTSFFRDPEAFEALKTDVLQKALRERDKTQKLRVWVAGCSTGEEVYSLAIMIYEEREKIEGAPEVQIIATDIDEHALSIARKGSYPVSIASDVSSERLAKYFVRKGGRYVIDKKIRELCLFSSHNLINDPPFSQIDLISCRNVLIYLGLHLQKKLIPVFHYALRPDGHLFLGSSESLSSHKELFRPVSVKHRIAQKKPTALRLPTSFAGSMTAYSTQNQGPASTSEEDLTLVAQRIAFDEFTPKYAIVNDEGQIVSVSAGLTKFLDIAEGVFSNDIVKVAHPNLRVALRATFAEAKKHKRQINYEACAMKLDNVAQRIGIVVQPMPKLGLETGLYMIVFRYLGTLEESSRASPPATSGAASLALLDQLENELAATRDQLDRTVQDLEASNEELKSSNEELLSMNEELQSSNEELEASKEEVQNANEGLQRSNSDLENLLTSTQIATLFLDDELKIRNFTPAVRAIYNIQPSDVGRSIYDFTTRAENMPKLPEPSELSEEGRSEIEIATSDGRSYLRRVLPYIDHDGRQVGMVVTFVDVSELRRTEGLFKTLANSMPQLAWMAERDGDIHWYNKRWYEYTGTTPESMAGWGWQSVHDPNVLPAVLENWKGSIARGTDFEMTFPLRSASGEFRQFLTRVFPLKDTAGQIVQWFGTNTDITDQLETQQALREAKEAAEDLNATLHSERARLQDVLNQSTVPMAMLEGPEHRLVFSNPAFDGLFALAGNSLGRTIAEIFPEAREQGFIDLLNHVHATGETFRATESPYKRIDPNGTERELYLDFTYAARRNAKNEIDGVLVVSVDVTEKVQARKNLERSQNDLQLEKHKVDQIIAQSPAAMAILRGSDLVFEKVNPSYSKMVGDRELIGKTFEEAFPELRGQPFHDLLKTVLDTGETYRGDEVPIEIFNPTTNRLERRIFSIAYQQILDSSGKPYGVYNFGLEITEQVETRKRLEESRILLQRSHYELEEKTAQLKTMIDHMPMAVVFADSSGKLLYANQQINTVWRHGFIPADDIDGYRDYVGFHPDGRRYEGKDWPLARALTTGETIVDEDHDVLLGDGTRGILRISAAPIRNAEGVITAGVVISEDVTERKKASQRLELLSQAGRAFAEKKGFEELLASIAEITVPDFADWCVVDLKEGDWGVRRYLIKHRDESKGTVVQRLAEMPVAPESLAFEVIRTGKAVLVVEVPDTELTKSGKFASFSSETLEIASSLGTKSFLCVPIRALGELRGVASFVLGHSGRRYSEADLTFASELATRLGLAYENFLLLEEAKRASSAKTQFLANMSHEIRTPLGAILGFAELIQEAGLATPEKRDYVATIVRNAHLLTNIVSEILDLSKIESNAVEIEEASIDLARVLLDPITTLQLRAGEKGIALSVSPYELTHPFVSSDSTRIKQVIFNLVGNAVKFTSEGRVRLEITQSPTEDGQVLTKVLVVDTGIGLSQDERAKLFKPFSQADVSMTRKYGGTGLGLVISKKIANLMGGDVKLLQSEPGEGSEFEFTFTARPVAPPVPSIAESQTGLQLDQMQVLIVDDSPDNRELLKRMLLRCGATVSLAGNGQEALEIAWEGSFDVILMDIQMPVLDGYESTARLRAKGYGGRIVALTAHAMKAEQERALREGFDAYLTKPVNKAELIATLRKLCDKS